MTVVARQAAIGLRANAGQFGLLVLINAFVGAMVGLQRSIVPLLGEVEFAVASATAATGFIITFGLAKAFTNLVSGRLAERYGRRHVLILGWLVGIPVPFVLMWAPSWGWVIAANALLGVNQGLAWSMTVTMKIDLVGRDRRGLAMGLNESSGYLAVGASAWIGAWAAMRWGLRPAPEWIGAAYALIGLALSVLVLRDTSERIAIENDAVEVPALDAARRPRRMASLCQAGLVNNLNDGMAWGIFPLLFTSAGLSLGQLGVITGLYPAVWGIGQLATGPLSDLIGRRPLIVCGMLVQASAHGVIGLGIARPWECGLVGAALLGIGTAMVYPSLLAAVSDEAAPGWRARALATYRFWRDMGYAVGALSAGLIADALGLVWAVHGAGAVTLLSGVVALWGLRRGTRD